MNGKNLLIGFYCGLFALACDGGSGDGNTDDTDQNDSENAGAGDSDFVRVTFPRQMENLDRGMAAVALPDGGVYVGWRLLGTDPADLGFNLYRETGGTATKLNDTPIVESTNFVDTEGGVDGAYYVRAVLEGAEQEASPAATVWPENFLRIPLQGDYGFDRVAVGDLDGDGAYDFVIKQPSGGTDPGVWTVPTDTYKLEAYRSTGEVLWDRRLDLGWNIVKGIWWSPLIVYDLDGDGRAEVVAKTAPSNENEDYRDADGKVLSGPEWLSVFDGETGDELARENWIDRGDPRDWGDDYGNRVSRNKLAVAYLDGKRPSLIVLRGIYGLMKIEAWNFRDGALTQVWDWSYDRGGGSQNTRVGDIDNDGLDEIINGSMAVDQDGSDMWITGESHADRVHLADIDPRRPGLEIWYCQEWGYTHPYHLRDARTGALIWGNILDGGDNNRAVVADVDPDNPGMEMWSQSSPNLFSANGDDLGTKPESQNWAVWWDGDLLRELVEDGRIAKYDAVSGMTEQIGTGVADRYSERYVGDIIGDWREELIYSVDGELRVYTTVIPTDRRFYTFMHDPLYRNDTAAEASGWMQYANTSFFFGMDMAPPPEPNIVTAPVK